MHSVMACLNFQNTYFRWLLLFVSEALAFQNTSKQMFSSLSKGAIFFQEYFYFKKSLKETRTFILTARKRGISSLLFIMFSSLLFMLALFKNFSLLAINLKILISLKRPNFNGHYQTVHPAPPTPTHLHSPSLISTHPHSPKIFSHPPPTHPK